MNQKKYYLATVLTNTIKYERSQANYESTGANKGIK